MFISALGREDGINERGNAGCFVLKFWIFSMLILFCIALYCEKDTDEADTLKSAEMRRRSIETFFG